MRIRGFQIFGRWSWGSWASATADAGFVWIHVLGFIRCSIETRLPRSQNFVGPFWVSLFQVSVLKKEEHRPANSTAIEATGRTV